MANDEPYGFGTLCINCFRDMFGRDAEPSYKLPAESEYCCGCAERIRSFIFARVQVSAVAHPEYLRIPERKARARK